MAQAPESECLRVSRQIDSHVRVPVIFHFSAATQEIIQSCQERFSNMMDLYTHTEHQPISSAAFFNLASIFAASQNGTLFAPSCATHLGLDTKQFPNLYPAVPSLKGSYNMINDLWRENLETPSTIGITQQPQLDLNFAYCSTPKTKLERPWDLRNYSHTNPILSFIFLFAFLTISVVLKFSSQIRSSTISDSLLLTLAGFLAAPHLKSGGNYVLLVVWMLSCQVISLAYTGSIASMIISPSEEVSISTLPELKKEKFRLIFDIELRKIYVNSTALEYFNKETMGKYAKSYSTVVNDITALQKLLARPVITANNMEDSIQQLISGQRLATIQSWHVAMYTVSRANELLQNEGRLDAVHCYLGKRLVPTSHLFYMVKCGTRNRICTLKTVLQYIYETGIYHYWMDEYVRSTYSRRVQDRIKISGPGRMKYDFEIDIPVPIKMEGSISKIFFVWLVGLAASIPRALYEFWSLTKYRSTIFIRHVV